MLIKMNEKNENNKKMKTASKDITKIKDIDESYIGKGIIIQGIVKRITKTPALILIALSDDTGSITLKKFIKTNQINLPEIKENQGVRVLIRIVEYQNIIEGEIINLKTIDVKDASYLLKKITKKSEPENKNFSINSTVYESMKELFTESAKMIRKAVLESRPIILRHHSDCDGYSGGFLVQEAIERLIANNHLDPKYIWYNFSRIPNNPPYFDYSDLTRDISFFLDNTERFGNKEPLYILIDFGSSKESLDCYRKLKLFNADIIVLDHHFSSQEEFNDIKNIVDIFINPHLFGGDENISAGMLSYELGLFIEKQNLDERLLEIPVISGLGDKSQGKEFESYKQQLTSLSRGLNFEYLTRLAMVLDYEAYYVRTFESKIYFKEFFTNKEIQQKIVELIYPRIEEVMNAYKKVIEENMKVIKETPFLVLLEDISMPFQFPNPGKITSFAHDLIKEREKRDDIATIYVYDTGIVFRLGKDLDINLNEKIPSLKKKYEKYLLNGGGHKRASSLRFLSIGKDEILKEILTWF